MEIIKDILLISDLDGTLLNSIQQISKENKEAIEEFKSMGGLFTVATGRMESAVKEYVDELDLKFPMILYNGAKIVCPQTWKVLYEEKLTMPQPLWEEMIAISDDCVGLLMYCDNEVYTVTKNQVIQTYEEKDRVEVKVIKDKIMGPLTKVLIISNPEILLKYEGIINDFEFKCSMVYSEETYLEVLPFGVTKGEALKQLKSMLTYPSLNTICIGDNLNDLTMLLEADWGIAVENAHPRLLKIANEITVHHEEHAIARVIASEIKKITTLG